MEAMIGFMWLCGTVSGVLWGAAMEQEKQEASRLYDRSMALFYSLCTVIMVIASL
jgi:hypothetical protein